MANKDRLKELEQERKLQKSILDSLLAQAKTEEARIKIKKGQVDILSSEGKTYKEHVELLKEVMDQVNEIKQSQKEGIDNLMNQEQKLKGLTGIQSSIVGFEREKIKLLAQEGSMHQNQKDAFGRISDLNQELLALSAEDIVSRGEIKRKIDDEISALDEKGKRQNGLGAGSRKLLELMKQEYAYADGISSLTESQQKILENQIKAYDTLKESVGTVFDTLAVATSGAGGFIGTLLTGAGAVANKIGKVNSELGTTLFQADGVGRKAGLLSFIFEDAAGTAKNLSAELGSTDRATFGLQTNVGLMAMNMGISNGEAATLVGTFSRLNGNSTDVASDLIASSREFAKQNNIIPAQLMGDLAASTEEFALFGKQGGKNIVEAAGYAAKLGVNMKSLSGIADNLLDFESSITKELELGAMLGRNINLNKARELAFQGNLEGAAKETLKAIGGQAAFERMNYYQRKQTADLMGVTVGELQKMVANEQQAATTAGMIKAEFSKVGEFINGGLNKYLGTSLQALGGMVASGAEFGANISMAGEGIGKLGGIFKKVGNTTETVTNTVETITDVKDIASTAGDVGDVAGSVKGAGIGLQLSSLAQGLSAMGTPKVLFGAFNLIPTGIGFIGLLPGIPGMIATSLLGVSTGTGLTALAGGLNMMGNPKTLLGALSLITAGVGLGLFTIGLPGMLAVSLLGVPTATGLTALAGGLMAMSGAIVGAQALALAGLGFMTMTLGLPGMIGVALFGGIANAGLMALSVGLTSFGAAAMNPLLWLGIGAIGALGLALIPMSAALAIAAPAISAFGDVLKGTFEGLASVISATSEGLVSMLEVITPEKALAMMGLASAFPMLALGIGSLAIAAALGGGTVNKFISGIAESASLLSGGVSQGIQTTAQALVSMGSGLAIINEQLDRLNPEKLEALSNFSMSLSIGGAVNAIGESIGGLVDSVSAVIGGGEGEEGSLSQYETDALRYLERIALATEKGATIKGRDRSAFNPMGINNN